MQSTKNPNETCSIITSIQKFILQSSLTHNPTNTTCRRTCYRIIIKGSSSLYLRWSDDLLQARIYGYYSVERNQGKTSKNLRIQGYNSKIVSADKAEREEDLKLDQSYLGFRPTVDTALIPLCNTRFIKGHKPSNHIRARIKSYVYTTE